MIFYNCEGCWEDWAFVCELIRKGHYYATEKDNDPFGRKQHFFVLVVDDSGKVVAWS